MADQFQPFGPDPNRREAAAARTWRAGVASLLVVGCLAGALVSWIALLDPFGASPPILLRIGIPVAAWLMLGAVGLQLVQFRQAQVTPDGISLERPVRRRDGTRTRTIRFQEITNVEPKVNQGREEAVLKLRDGTSISMPRSMFGGRGLSVMEDIFSRFGRSYQGEMKSILLEGKGGSGFRTVRIRRFDGDMALLRTKIPSYSGSEIRSITPAEVREFERVSTPYAGEAYLVTLGDGTRFLVPLRYPETARLAEVLRRQPQRQGKATGS